MPLAIAAGAATYMAMRGGSYDLVVRQEAALVLWWSIGLAVATGLLPRALPSRAALVPLLAVSCLAAWTATSLAWTESDEATLAELARVLLYLGVVSGVWLLADAGSWRAAAAGLTVAGVIVCAAAVASRLGPGVFPDDTVARVFGSRRLSYPLNYWNALAAWGAMSVVLLLAWSAHARTQAARVAALAALPVSGVAVYLTYSRAGIACTALGIVSVIALCRNRLLTCVHVLGGATATTIAIVGVRSEPAIALGKPGGAGAFVLAALAAASAAGGGVAALTHRVRADRWRLERRHARVAAATLLTTVAVSGFIVGPPLISAAWEDFHQGAPEARSDDPAGRLTGLGGNRHLIWSSAFDGFLHKPVTGLGAGSFEFWWNRRGGGEYLRDAHSLFLEQLAELGVPGLTLTVTFLVGLGWAALRGRSRLRNPVEIGAHAGLVGAFVVMLAAAGVDWIWESTAVAATGLAAVALAASPAARPGRPFRGRTRTALVAAAALAALIQVPGLLSTSLIRQSQASLRAGDVTAASGYAAHAVAVQPWAASPYDQRGLIAEELGALDMARRDLLRAVERERTNWRHHLLLTRIEAQRGRRDAALAALRRARSLRPKSRFFAASSGSAGRQ